MHDADRHELIRVHGARVNNLGGGCEGGRIVFEGTPADLVAGRSTLTGEHLATHVGADEVRAVRES